MSVFTEVSIKIISSPIEKIIGWKGDVLEIGLNTDDKFSKDILVSFLSKNLNIKKENIQIDQNDKIFKVKLLGKYVEDPRILFSDITDG